MNFSEFEKEIIRRTKELEAENKMWSKEFNKAMTLRTKAKEHEKNGKVDLAIKCYVENIKFIKESTKINQYSTIAHDIDRLAILYSKTKQFDLLINLLSENIELYGLDERTTKWKDRLNKLINK
jgi:hypothetical protein